MKQQNYYHPHPHLPPPSTIRVVTPVPRVVNNTTLTQIPTPLTVLDSHSIM